VEVVTGLLFVAAALQAVSLSELLYLWVVVALLVVIAVYDLYHYIIPDSLTAALTGISLVWLSYQSFLAGSVDMLLWGVGAAGFGSLFLFTLWAISKGRWIGFGDVKLAFPLGLIVGVSFVFSMIVLSFWIGAAVSLLLVGLARLQRGKLSLRFFPTHLTIKSVVPFAPFLIAGCLFVLFFHFNVLTLFTL
jgi:prepilin signal peptidase PulO-like enzyme (type II secretory pathway)